MPTRYYVTAQQLDYPFAIKRLYGPFETFRAASMMEQPVRAAIAGDPEFINVNVRATGMTAKRHPPGALDLARLNINDVIKASITRR